MTSQNEYGLFEAPLLWVMFCWMGQQPIVFQMTLGEVDVGRHHGPGLLAKIVRDPAPQAFPSGLPPLVRQFSIYDTLDYGESL